jgi:glycosyltransferase involved in cell wall biosynthesis
VSINGAKCHLHCVQALDAQWGGGLASATLDLHREMLHQGTVSAIVATRGRHEKVTVPGVHEFARVGSTRMFFSPSLWAQAPTLAADADFVHLQGLYAATNWAVGRAARKAGVSIVCHPHGMFEPYILARSRQKKRFARWLFEDANMNAAALWRALTNVEADQVRAMMPGARIAVIPNGVTIPARAAGHHNTRRIGYLGRIHEKKGLPLLLKAWAQLAGEFPNWELVIAGPGELDYVQTICHAAKQLPRVVVHGEMIGPSKDEFLESLNLFVLPSLSEGFPMAVLEAMATGVPVVVTTTSNAPLVDASAAGWTCEPSAVSIGKAIGDALSSGVDELSQRGAAARALVGRDYTWDRVASTLVDACEAA